MRSTMEHRLVGVWERKLETETRSSWSTQNHVARNIRLGDGFENSRYDYLAERALLHSSLVTIIISGIDR